MYLSSSFVFKSAFIEGNLSFWESVENFAVACSS